MRGEGMPNAVIGWPTGVDGAKSPTVLTQSSTVSVSVKKKRKKITTQMKNLLW